jgi:phosphohistidine phosphatase SixA
MARKRALVDAALTAGRLSELFTQDVEDLGAAAAEVEVPPAPEATDHPKGLAQEGEPSLRMVFEWLKEKDPAHWSDDKVIKALDRRTGLISQTIEDALAALSPEQVDEVDTIARATYASLQKDEG